MPDTRKADRLSSLFEDLVFTAPWPGPGNSDGQVDPESWGVPETETSSQRETDPPDPEPPAR
jgi:hypothetical protein